MVGLDAAGKTTILYKLKLGEIVTTIPTIGKRGCTYAKRNSSDLPKENPSRDIALNRVQRGDRRIQEHQFHSLGRGRTGQNQTSLEALLPEHAR